MGEGQQQALSAVTVDNSSTDDNVRDDVANEDETTNLRRVSCDSDDAGDDSSSLRTSDSGKNDGALKSVPTRNEEMPFAARDEGTAKSQTEIIGGVMTVG